METTGAPRANEPEAQPVLGKLNLADESPADSDSDEEGEIVEHILKMEVEEDEAGNQEKTTISERDCSGGAPSSSAAAAARRGLPVAKIAVGLGISLVIAGVNSLRKYLQRRSSGAAKGAILLEPVSLLPPPQPAPPAAAQQLRGLKFAVSDVFNIEGHTCSLGRPEWKAYSMPAPETATIIKRIVEGGAQLVGVSNVSSDFLSIQGRNTYYGTPLNPAAPGHIIGGFHGGAAAAVASGMVDFAVAAEGFGGLRVPAACCGILGFMASPGAVPEDGLWNAAVNTGALGWLARSADVLGKVGVAAVAGSANKHKYKVRRVMIAEDLFAQAQDEQAAAMLLDTTKRAAFSFVGKDNVMQIRLGDMLSRNVPALNELGGPGPFENLQAAYTIVAAYECAKQCSKWADANNRIANVAQEGIEHAQQISEDAYKVCVQVMQDVRKVMYLTLERGTVVALPTIGTPPIKWNSSDEAQEQWAVDAIKMCALAPMAACPQVTMPAGRKGAAPMGVSLVGQHKSDSSLLEAAEALAPILQEEADKKPPAPRVDPQEAKRAKEAAELERKREQAEGHKEVGNRAFKDGRYEAAIREYGRAIDANPKEATYYSNRAMASLKMMNFSGAEDDCTQALKLELNAKTLLRRGTARLGLHNFEGSLKDFKQVLAMEPNNRQARIELKNLKEMKARFDEMQAAAQSAEGGNSTIFGGTPPMDSELMPPPLGALAKGDRLAGAAFNASGYGFSGAPLPGR